MSDLTETSINIANSYIPRRVMLIDSYGHTLSMEEVRLKIGTFKHINIYDGDVVKIGNEKKRCRKQRLLAN